MLREHRGLRGVVSLFRRGVEHNDDRVGVGVGLVMSVHTIPLLDGNGWNVTFCKLDVMYSSLTGFLVGSRLPDYSGIFLVGCI